MGSRPLQNRIWILLGSTGPEVRKNIKIRTVPKPDVFFPGLWTFKTFKMFRNKKDKILSGNSYYAQFGWALEFWHKCEFIYSRVCETMSCKESISFFVCRYDPSILSLHIKSVSVAGTYLKMVRNAPFIRNRPLLMCVFASWTRQKWSRQIGPKRLIERVQICL